MFLNALTQLANENYFEKVAMLMEAGKYSREAYALPPNDPRRQPLLALSKSYDDLAWIHAVDEMACEHACKAMRAPAAKKARV